MFLKKGDSMSNSDFANKILFSDPETSEELRPYRDPESIDGSFVIYVENKDGSRKWKHTIKTEEV